MRITNEEVLLCHDTRDYLISREFSGIANYSVVDVSGEVVELENTACIADLMYLNRNIERGKCDDPLLCVYYLPTCTRHYNERGAPEVFWEDISTARLRFLDYLYKRSFLKDVYVLTEHFNPTLNDTLVTRCDVSSKLFGLANNILRIGIENQDHLESWVTLVDAGVNEDLAFIMCEYVGTTIKGGLVVFKDKSEWYHSVLTSCSCVVFADVVKGKNKLPSDTYTEEATYAVRGDLSGGRKINGMIKAQLCYHSVITKAKLDLMGDISEPARRIVGFTINELNKFWEEY